MAEENKKISGKYAVVGTIVRKEIAEAFTKVCGNLKPVEAVEAFIMAVIEGKLEVGEYKKDDWKEKGSDEQNG